MFCLDPGIDRLQLPDGATITEDRGRIRHADAVIFHIPSLDWFFYRRKAANQIWVAWSQECEQHYSRLSNPRFMKQFDLTMTYHPDADVMHSYIPEELINRSMPAPAPGGHEHLSCSFISGWADRSGRMEYLKRLAERMDVHQYGRCGDRAIVNDQGRPSKLSTCSRYKFSLAFENAIAPDYVTEKLYEPLVAGSVPVYLGAPNVARLAPREDCFINAADFSGPDELAGYLLELDRDELAYARYLNWREQPYAAEFSALCERNRTHPLVRLCKRLITMRTEPATAVMTPY
jgi:hypothetical protein